jgi:NADH-quinone oxidoreductase subunit H
MGHNAIEITINAIKLIVVFLLIVQAVPVLVWLERRGSAFIQNRLGPNRIGPLGLMQLLADAVKFLFKEEFMPKDGVKLLYYAAPIFALVPATLAFAAIPLGFPVHWDEYIFRVQGYEMNVGIVFILAVSSLGPYSILMAGWGSGNKYALMGALRASAQVISYELALGLSIVGVILLYGTFNLPEMVQAQEGPLSFIFMGNNVSLPFLPNWGIFYQPLGALIFFAAAFAESNRLPFDLAEGEAELVAGFHVEYGGFKMLLFFIGEYGHMMVSSALMVTFFFGGYEIPYVSMGALQEWVGGFASSPNIASLVVGLITFVAFTVKLAVFLWIFIQVRWTLPRFRYDQLMDLGWKTMLPWALFNTILTAMFVYLAHL